MEYRILGPSRSPDKIGWSRSAVAVSDRSSRSCSCTRTRSSSERLIDELWGESPPPTARKTVQVYVSQLR